MLVGVVLVEATQPEASSEVHGLGARPSFVQWIYPSALLTPVAPKTVVGRDPTLCHAVLSGKEVSRTHAELCVDGPIVVLRDLDSRNGVFLNGCRIRRAPVGLGDVVRCGEWIGILTDGLAPNEFGEIASGWFGGSTLRRATEPLRKLALPLPIVIQGETGTGKEGMARAIHSWSGRRGAFIPVNCAALAEQLADAELFGYRKGAFTGANESAPGLFRAADGGTLFLDEVLELPLSLQAKLLRVLQESRVRSIGDARDSPVDVRVVAAAQAPLAAAVEERKFRADLLARLDGLTVVLPPLRARREDVLPLFWRFFRDVSASPVELDAKFVECLLLHEWPQNVRELSFLARRLAALHSTERRLTRAHLPSSFKERSQAGEVAAEGMNSVGSGAVARRVGVGVVEDDASPVADVVLSRAVLEPPNGKRGWRRTRDQDEFQQLVAELRRSEGSVAKAAAALGLSRARAYRLLSAHPTFSLSEVRK